MLFTLFATSVLVGSSIFAWRIGGVDERFAATAFLVTTLATNAANSNNYAKTETGVLLIDAVLLAGLVTLALRSDRFWPIWAAAFQLVGNSVHFASMAETGDFAWAYAVGLIFWSYPVIIALMVGIWREARHC
jgi:hypothetical protein